MDITYVDAENSKVEQVKPGETVGVRVRADPDSTCHVLAIDKSVLLLKTGNDIEPAMVSFQCCFKRYTMILLIKQQSFALDL